MNLQQSELTIDWMNHENRLYQSSPNSLWEASLYFVFSQPEIRAYFDGETWLKFLSALMESEELNKPGLGLFMKSCFQVTQVLKSSSDFAMNVLTSIVDPIKVTLGGQACIRTILSKFKEGTDWVESYPVLARSYPKVRVLDLLRKDFEFQNPFEGKTPEMLDRDSVAHQTFIYLHLLSTQNPFPPQEAFSSKRILQDDSLYVDLYSKLSDLTFSSMKPQAKKELLKRTQQNGRLDWRLLTFHFRKLKYVIIYLEDFLFKELDPKVANAAAVDPKALNASAVDHNPFNTSSALLPASNPDFFAETRPNQPNIAFINLASRPEASKPVTYEIYIATPLSYERHSVTLLFDEKNKPTLKSLMDRIVDQNPSMRDEQGQWWSQQAAGFQVKESTLMSVPMNERLTKSFCRFLVVESTAGGSVPVVLFTGNPDDHFRVFYIERGQTLKQGDTLSRLFKNVEQEEPPATAESGTKQDEPKKPLSAPSSRDLETLMLHHNKVFEELLRGSSGSRVGRQFRALNRIPEMHTVEAIERRLLGVRQGKTVEEMIGDSGDMAGEARHLELFLPSDEPRLEFAHQPPNINTVKENLFDLFLKTALSDVSEDQLMRLKDFQYVLVELGDAQQYLNDLKQPPVLPKPAPRVSLVGYIGFNRAKKQMLLLNVTQGANNFAMDVDFIAKYPTPGKQEAIDLFDARECKLQYMILRVIPLK
jgi:hypothetical protein